MAITGDTGHGFTVTFGTSGFTALMRECDLPNEVRQAIDAAYVGDASVLKIPGDTTDHGQFTLRWVFNPTVAMPTFAAAETITITLPKMNSGSSAASTLAGTGFVTERKYPNLQSNQLNEGTLVGVFDGDTGPTFTVEA